TDAGFDFNDLASPQSSHHEIRQLALSIPVVGNVSYLTDEYVTPELSMLLNGADIHAQGQSKPFDNSLETDLSFSFFNTDLAFYARNSPVPLPIDVTQGILDCEIDIKYQVSGSELPKLIVCGDFVLSDLIINEPDADPLFSMPTLLVTLEEADVFQQDITLSAIELYEPRLSVSRDAQGELNLIRLFASSQTEESSPPAVEGAAKTSDLPLLLIKKLTLNDGQISFSDHAQSTELTEQIHHLSLEVDNFSTHQEQQATVNLQLQTDRNLELSVDGNLGLVPA
ncbi:MAG: DUF748 domain-containing protein, partial [Desulfuromonas sp.]|nr:DUF748 domain-containing protein [Desulfuromonas sp.]